jgi:signal peptidase
VLSLAVWSTLPVLWGWHAYTVTSGSMAPLVEPGDVVVAAPVHAPARLKPGTVIVVRPFHAGGEPVTHRVITRLPDGTYRTKGDANPEPDARLSRPDQVVARARIVVPMAGLIQFKLGRRAAALGLVLIVLSLALPALIRRRRLTTLAVVGLLAVGTGTAATTQAAFNGRSQTAAGTFGTVSQFYYQAILATGPVSYWRMSSSSTTVPDEMGVAALALTSPTAYGRTGAINKDSNGATRFTKSVSYATVSNTAHNITGNVTVAAWTNASVTGTNARLVFKGTAPQNGLNYLLAWDSAGTHMRFLVDTPATSSRPSALDPGIWPVDGAYHFVVGVYDGSAVRLYIDAVMVNSAAGSGTLATTSAALTVSEGSSSSFTGDVDEVAVWNKALTPAQITNLYTIAKQ